MRSLIFSKRITIPLIIAGLILSVILFFLITPKRSATKDIPPAEVNTGTAPVTLPSRLKIPTQNVDALIEHVGLTKEGAMDAPKGPAEVAWFSLGVRPGENGSAVIAGHYGWKNNKPAAFDSLHTLRKGDTVLVEDENGVMMTFIVREMKTYDKDEIVPEVFSSIDGNAHLNLITCTGAWNDTEKTHSHRLVVFTDRQIDNKT